LPSSRRVAFDFLVILYRTTEGKNEVTRLGAGILRNVAEKMHCGGIEDHEEHAFAVVFFLVYASDHSDFRQYVFGPSLTCLASSLQTLIAANAKPDVLLIDGSMRRICYGLLFASRRAWAIASLLEADLCNLLLRVLRVCYCPGFTGKTFHFILEILYNIWSMGEESGRRAVCNAITAPDKDILYDLQKEQWTFDWMGERARQWTDRIMEVCS